MNKDALKQLAENAMQYGKTFAAVKEALVMQGVDEKEAREEARYAAGLAAIVGVERGTGETCPLCGK